MPSEGEVNSTWVDLRRSVHRPPLPVVPLSSSSSLKLKLCLILRLFSPVSKTAAATLRYYLPRALSHALSYTLIVSCPRLASTLLHAPSLSRFDQSLVAVSLADFPDPICSEEETVFSVDDGLGWTAGTLQETPWKGPLRTTALHCLLYIYTSSVSFT